MSRASLLLVAAACGSSAPRTAPAPLVSNKTAPEVALRAGGTSDDLALLPIDSELVARINLRQIAGSPIWQQRLAPMLLALVGKQVNAVQAACGYDPMETMSSIAIGVKRTDTGNPEGVIVLHGVPRDKTLACMPAIEQEAVKDGGTTKHDGDAVIVTDKTGQTVAFEMIDDSTMLLMVNAQASKQGLDAIARGRSGLAGSPAFVAMYRKLHPGASIWLLVNGTAKALSNLGALGVTSKGLYATLDVTDKLELVVTLRLASPMQAATLASQLQGQSSSPQVQQLFDRFAILANRDEVDIRITLGDPKLQALIAMIGPLLGP